MNTKAIFTIVAIVAAIGMLGMAAVAIPSVPQAHANAGGVPNAKADGNPTKHCTMREGPGKHNGEPCTG
jgi:Flp pilus assembly protein CpaB